MSSDSASWYIATEGKPPSGPYNAEQIIEAWEGGHLTATFCWREGMTDWLPLAQVEPFRTKVPQVNITRRIAWPLLVAAALVAILVIACITAFGVALSTQSHRTVEERQEYREDPEEVKHAKTIRLPGYGDAPLGEVLDHFMNNPRWQVSRGKDGYPYVTARGRVDYMSKSSLAMIRFRLAPGQLGLEGLEVDGRPQTILVASDFLRKAYGSYVESHLKQ